MPNYPVHTTVNLVGIGACAAVGLKVGWMNLETLVPFTLGAVVATVLVSPDIDLFKSHAVGNWGGLKYILWPYSEVAHHRGMSHAPFLGTATRYAYFLALLGIGVGIGIALNAISIDTLAGMLQNNDIAQTGLLIFLGSVYADCLHIGADALLSHGRRHK